MKRDELLVGKQFPVEEARGLYRMLSTGSTVEDLRVAVPPKTERILRGFAEEDPADAHWIEAAVNFRQAVALEFDRAWLPRRRDTRKCGSKTLAERPRDGTVAHLDKFKGLDRIE